MGFCSRMSRDNRLAESVLGMEAVVCHLDEGSTADKLCWLTEEEMEREDK